MLVEIRLYRRHDADLMMLRSYDSSIQELMMMALKNYVQGQRIKIRLPEAHSHSLDGCTMIRFRLDIQDPQIIDMLHQIKKGYRNQFCKALLRDLLDCEPLGVYMEDSLIASEQGRVSSLAQLSSQAVSDMKPPRRGRKTKQPVVQVSKNTVSEIPAQERPAPVVQEQQPDPERTAPVIQEQPPAPVHTESPPTTPEQPKQTDLDFGEFGQQDMDDDESRAPVPEDKNRQTNLFAMFEDLRNNAE